MADGKDEFLQEVFGSLPGGRRYKIFLIIRGSGNAIYETKTYKANVASSFNERAKYSIISRRKTRKGRLMTSLI